LSLLVEATRGLGLIERGVDIFEFRLLRGSLLCVIIGRVNGLSLDLVYSILFWVLGVKDWLLTIKTLLLCTLVKLLLEFSTSKIT
jgi:hypothetical protein